MCSFYLMKYCFLEVRYRPLKGNTQFIFLCNPQTSSFNVCLMNMLKSTITKKVIVCFYK